MKITLNGKETVINATTVTELITELDMTGKPVVIEKNKSALVASAHASTPLEEGDEVEMFVLGAGG